MYAKNFAGVNDQPVTIAAPDTVLAEVRLDGKADELWVSVANKNPGAALSAFAAEVQVHAGDPTWDPYVADADFANGGTENLPWCSTLTPHNLAAGSRSNFRLKVTGAHAVRFKGSGNGAVVTVRGTVAPRV
jgi:hypothetical protein